MKCMIVDDAGFSRNMLRQILQKIGFDEFCEAANGKEAILYYPQFKPDLVTMDITMPEMSGIETIQRLIKIDPKAQIVVCTALGQKSIVIQAITFGAKHYLVKPLDENKVMETIKTVLHIS